MDKKIEKKSGNYNFKEDLAVALVTEKEVAKILEKIYNAEIISFNNSNEYDILTKQGDKFITYEVKEDFSCSRTGNVGLEYHCRGKLSGISVSKADYYIYKVHTKNEGIQFFEYKTSILRDMVAKKLYWRDANGGDKGSNSWNYLFRYEVFKKYGKNITPAA